ncbi:uncharacterized protein B0P05DRAFT_602816 [Gilbertella persicaria]|uniref:uncharacterized protein n=1 Tax=Gilbertella persicaria TaxID=101096 RepID=UPI00222007D5|nr:uncharacterized protein B0P05DRAFT_602816 [Gilbertella persicaria]KAI8087027.1 hypothetical protein B0P05DRAFT_602816 [Gilbertella persicaria]
MANPSPRLSSLSPSSNQPTSAFQWPIPSSPSQLKSITNDITVKEILDRYSDDPEILKYILTAKSEEDKKKAARDTLKAEEARIRLRQMDLEIAKETKQETPVQVIPQPPLPQQPVIQTPVHHPSYGPYYGLAPVQQQVLARFHYPPNYGPPQQHQAPSSPSVPYPHSAHPLCPPSNSERLQPPSFRQISPTSPREDSKKRNRSSISLPHEQSEPQDKLSHNKVMEALKAKIQRGGNGGGPPSPLTASPVVRPPPEKKRKPTLPRPVLIEQPKTSSSPSPRSAKPILPPIDTSLGRILPAHMSSNSNNNNNGSSSSSSSSSSSMILSY